MDGHKLQTVHSIMMQLIFLNKFFCWQVEHLNFLLMPLEYCDFIDQFSKKFSCDTAVKYNLDYLKLNVIRPKKVLVSKPRGDKWCTCAPTIAFFEQPTNHVRKQWHKCIFIRILAMHLTIKFCRWQTLTFFKHFPSISYIWLYLVQSFWFTNILNLFAIPLSTMMMLPLALISNKF